VVYTGLNKLKPRAGNEIPPAFVSIIVPFRNESENILNSYNSLINQEYPEEMHEIIFVNDFSTDDSLEKLVSKNHQDNVKILSVPENYSVNAHKKRAIRYGIENAKGEIIVTTDADCTHSKHWLKSLLRFMDEKTGFISGPVEFKDGKSLFENLQKLEFAGLVITGAGLIGSGKPTICNAANIAYRKKVYEEVGGFNDQLNLSSGDDELLMQKISKDTSYEVKFAHDRNATVETSANKTVGEFYQQRKRWASKGLFYRDKTLVIKLILIYLFYISLAAQLVLGLTGLDSFLILFLLSISFKIILEYLIISRGAKLYFNRKILSTFPAAEIIHIPYIIIAGISGVFGDYKWKDRRLNR
jgi:cellulose synthase/poly-beta-1,6-N-acetylglucosamine synthase-like glycosyltransferase